MVWRTALVTQLARSSLLKYFSHETKLCIISDRGKGLFCCCCSDSVFFIRQHMLPFIYNGWREWSKLQNHQHPQTKLVNLWSIVCALASSLPLYPSGKIKSITKSRDELTEKRLIIITINLRELPIIWVKITAPAEYKSQGKSEKSAGCAGHLYAWDPQLVAHKMNPLALGGDPELQAQHPSHSLGSGPSNSEKPPAELGGSPALVGVLSPALWVRPHRAVSAVLSPAWHSRMFFF